MSKKTYEMKIPRSALTNVNEGIARFRVTAEQLSDIEAQCKAHREQVEAEPH